MKTKYGTLAADHPGMTGMRKRRREGLSYSSRNATIGSSREARQAGSPQAMTAMTRKPAAIAAKVAGSVGSTPTSIVRIAPVSRNAAAMPAAIPTALSRRP